MKRLNWLMMLMAAFTMSLAACEKDAPEPGPGPEPGPDEPVVELNFALEVLGFTRNSVEFNITPSLLDAEYAVFAYPSSEVEKCATDAEIVEKIYAQINETATAEKTFADIMAGIVQSGAVEGDEIVGLNSDMSYYLLVFGVDAANNYAATTDVTKAKFKTAAAPVSSCTFEVAVSAYLTTAAISVTPSIDTQKWHLVVVDVDTYKSYTDAEGEYGWTIDEFFNNALQTDLEACVAEGGSVEDFVRKEVFEGKRTVNAASLEAKTKYTCLVAGVAIEGEEILPCTSVREVRFNSGEVAASNLSFDIEVFNIGNYSADVRITPSDPDAEYYYYINYIDTKTKGAKPIDIANNAINEYIYYWDNNTIAHREPSKGVVDLTGENCVALDIAETEYYIVVFSFDVNPNYGQVINEETGEYDTNPGTITSAPAYVSFMTSKHGDPAAVEFEFKGTDVGPYDFNLEVKSSDPTIFYQPGLAYATNFDPQAAIAASADQLALVMQMCMEGQSPCLTYQEALDKLKKQGYPYRNGDNKFYVANLYPETSYIGYALVIDITTGKFVRCVYSDVIATTTPVGSVNPTVELLGVYDGNEENGTIFGNSDLTAGRAVVAFEYKNFDGASALYASFTEGDVTDVTNPKFSDQYIISEFRGYWDSITLAAPYYFYVAEWNYDQSALTYALDSNDREGKVGRLLINPKDKTGEVAELKAYVDAVAGNTTDAYSAYKASKSMVYSTESLEPTMECVWSQDVELPKAKVVRHEVETIALEGDIEAIKAVRSIRF